MQNLTTLGCSGSAGLIRKKATPFPGAFTLSAYRPVRSEQTSWKSRRASRERASDGAQYPLSISFFVSPSSSLSLAAPFLSLARTGPSPLLPWREGERERGRKKPRAASLGKGMNIHVPALARSPSDVGGNQLTGGEKMAKKWRLPGARATLVSTVAYTATPRPSSLSLHVVRWGWKEPLHATLKRYSSRPLFFNIDFCGFTRNKHIFWLRWLRWASFCGNDCH